MASSIASTDSSYTPSSHTPSPNGSLPPSPSSQLEQLDFARNSLSQIVKEDAVDPIIDACQRVFETSIKDFSLITGGRGTSKILKVTLDGGKEYVCRVTDSARSTFYIDTESEIKIMRHINDLGVAPKLHHADPESCVILMDSIANQRLTPDHFKGEKLYSQLATALRNLHTGPLMQNEVTDIFKDLEATFKEGKFEHMPPAVLQALEKIRPLQEVLKKHQTVALCHKDLHSNNALYDGENLYLIDWELAANCDPFVDLAFATMFFTFDKDKEDLFLKNYFKADPTPNQRAHFFLMKQVVLCVYACRLLRKVTANFDISKDPIPSSLPNYKDFVLENYNGCDRSFTPADLKTFAYMFLRELTQNLATNAFAESVQELSK